MKGLLPCSRSGRCTENNVEEPQMFGKQIIEDGEKIWKSPLLKQKIPWKHPVWVYICVLLLPENMGHLGGPK